MTALKKFRAYLRLMRIQTAGATGCAPLLGALLAGMRDVSLLFIIFLTGVIYHIYSFVLNEYTDLEIDKKAACLTSKPLVSGELKEKHALNVTFASFVLGIMISIIFLSNFNQLVFLILAFISGTIYDFYGKRFTGLDFIYALSLMFLVFSGAFAFTDNINAVVYLVAAVFFLHIGFNNAVEGGLKDVENDNAAGVITIAVALGVKVEDNRLFISKGFLAFAGIMKALFVFFIILIILQRDFERLIKENYFELLLISFFLIIMFYTMAGFLRLDTYDRNKMKKLFSGHEMSSFFALITSLLPFVGFAIKLTVFFIPAVWYISFNILLYGKALQPAV